MTISTSELVIIAGLVLVAYGIEKETIIMVYLLEHYRSRGGNGPGGGGALPLLKVSETCRWTGYDFAIIAIKTGCLNQPNHWHRVSKSAYLATGTDYSVYHRVAFPPTMFMTGPRSRHRRDASVRAGPVFQRSLIFLFMNGSSLYEDHIY